MTGQQIIPLAEERMENASHQTPPGASADGSSVTRGSREVHDRRPAGRAPQEVRVKGQPLVDTKSRVLGCEREGDPDDNVFPSSRG